MRAVFDDFVFDSELRALTRGGLGIHLTPKAFDLLHLLLEKRPRPVAAAEIMNHLWRGCFVVRGNLANLVLEIRTALGDAGRASRYIRTVHRYGYVFCGATAAPAPTPAPAAGSPFRLLMRNGQVPIGEGETTIGRSPDCRVTLPFPTVSRCHARILLVGGKATLEDLRSTNGTFVNGTRIERSAPLADGDRIQLGSVPATFRILQLQSTTDRLSGSLLRQSS
jgi:DNA-binding winged helix-turn-helix (wHTH) protein